MGFFAANAKAGEDDGTGTIEIDVTPGEDGGVARAVPELAGGGRRRVALARRRRVARRAPSRTSASTTTTAASAEDSTITTATIGPGRRPRRGGVGGREQRSHDGGSGRGGGKKRTRRAAGPRRPAGTPHKLERARMAKRKSSPPSAPDPDTTSRTRTAFRASKHEATHPPLEYWRGETKRYVRVHQSLPTVETMTHRTPNPMWPRHKTPHHAHGGGAIIAVGGSVPLDSERASRRAGEEARDARSSSPTSRTSRTETRRTTRTPRRWRRGKRRSRRPRGRPRQPRARRRTMTRKRRREAAFARETGRGGRRGGRRGGWENPNGLQSTNHTRY